MQYKRLSAADMAAMFGTTETELRAAAGGLMETHDLEYRELLGKERDDTILEVLKVMDAGVLRASGPERHGDWEDGWAENLAEFAESGGDVAALLPKYYHKDRPCRMAGGFVRGRTGAFLFCASDIFRRWLYKRWFAACPEVHEFGCGTGHNLVVLGELFPKMKLIGYDWASSSQRLLDLVRQRLGLDIRGQKFDFFAPEQKYSLGAGAGVLTFGALEQVGARHGAFLEALLAAQPSVCVHVEGFDELYSQHELMDYVALRYHKTRNYLDGYLTALRALEAEGRIEILATWKAQLGNLFDDPYSYVVWKPRQA